MWCNLRGGAACAVMFLVIAAGMAEAFGNETILVEAGKPAATIMTGREASVPEKFAAREFQRYIRLMTGAELPLVSRRETVDGTCVLVGTSASHEGIATWEAEVYGPQRGAARPGAQGFAVCTTDTGLVIAGSDPAGVVYGVYDVLEDVLGCVWFAPGDDLVPRRSRISLPALDVRETPAFDLRATYSGFADDDEAVIDWLAKLKASHVMSYIGVLKRREYGPGFEAERAANPNLAADVVDALSDRVEKRGMHLAYVVHSYWYFLPYEKYFDAHPDYFSLIDGERHGARTTHHWQYCVSNPEVLRVVSDNVIEFFRRYPRIDLVSMDPNDGSGDCQCEMCRRLDADIGMNRYLWFADQVARRVRSACPGKKISINIGYSPCRLDEPPAGVEFSDNLVFMRGFLNRSFGHSLFDEKMNARASRAIRAWGGEFAERFYTLDTLYNIYGTRDMMAAPMFEVLGREWSSFRELGLWGGASMGSLQERNLPLEYVYKHVLWNPAQPVDGMLDHYCRAFGAAGKPMRAFLDVLMQGMRRLGKADRRVSTDYRSFVDRWLAPADVEKADAWCEAALTEVKPGSAERGRVESWMARWNTIKGYWNMAYKGQDLIPEDVTPPLAVHDPVKHNLIVIGDFTPRSLRDLMDSKQGVGQRIFYEEGTDSWVCEGGLVVGNPLQTMVTSFEARPGHDREVVRLRVEGDLVVQDGARLVLNSAEAEVRGDLLVGLETRQLRARGIADDAGSAELCVTGTVLRVGSALHVKEGGGLVCTESSVSATAARVDRYHSGVPTVLEACEWTTREGVRLKQRRTPPYVVERCDFVGTGQLPAIRVRVDEEGSPLVFRACSMRRTGTPVGKPALNADIVVSDQHGHPAGVIEAVACDYERGLVRNPNARLVRGWPVEVDVQGVEGRAVTGVVVRLTSSLGESYTDERLTDGNGKARFEAPASVQTAAGLQRAVNDVSVVADGQGQPVFEAWTPDATTSVVVELEARNAGNGVSE